ncbi:MAG: helix-turn-helix domain-containing protein [archaeon]
MEIESLFGSAKWKILEKLAKEKLSPMQLAEKTKTSIANISQQLALLEAYNFVKKEKTENTNKKGKPKTLYSLAKDIAYVVYAKPGFANKKLFRLDAHLQNMMNVLFLDKKEDAYFISKFLWQYEDMVIPQVDAIFFLKSDNDIELTIISNDQRTLDEIRKKLSNVVLENLEKKKKKIVIWSHSTQEIEEGLKKKEAHFKSVTHNLYSIYDPKNLLSNIEAWKNE